MRCNSEEFKRNENALVEQEFRGELFKLKAPVMECTKCGWQALADDMADELLKRTGDAYRQRHGLLTSTEIINRFRLL
jgi:predicted small metal-binding protein